MSFTIDPEIQTLLPQLTQDEYNSLENQILEGLHIDAVVVGIVNSSRILIDGHNRVSICGRHGIQFPIREKKFSNREQLVQWVIDNQLARRNLTDERLSYYRGKASVNKSISISKDAISELHIAMYGLPLAE